MLITPKPSAAQNAASSSQNYTNPSRENKEIFPETFHSRWSAATTLDAEAARYFFLPERTIAKMWTYRADNRGFCVALMRQNPKDLTTPPLIGTICTDEDQRRACFFDNQVYGAGD